MLRTDVPWKALVDHHPDGVLAFDRECRYTAWNPAMERIAGLPAERVVGRLAWEVFPFLREEGEDEYFVAALHGEAREAADRRFRIPETAREGYFRAAYGPLRDAAGEIVGGMAVVRDTTRTRQAEELLRLRGLILESTSEGVSVSDEDGFLVYTNPAEDRMFGYGPGELVGTHVTAQNAYPPDRNRRIVAEVIERLRARGEWVGRWDNVRKDGTPFVTRARITALDLGGRPHWVCVREDVTEQTRVAAENERLYREAREAEEAQRFLADTSALLGRTLDLDETLHDLCRLAVERFADACAIDLGRGDGTLERRAVLSREQGIAELVRELEARYPTPPDSPAGHATAFRTGTPQLYTSLPDELLRSASRDEEHFRLWKSLRMESALSAPLVARGRAIGVVTFVSHSPARTFDHRKLELAVELARRAALAIDNARLYAAARAADRAKTDFLAAMSHELRTPLDAIAGHLDAVESGAHGPVAEAQREALRQARRSQESLLARIDDLLHFARLEAGRMEYRIAEVDVGATIEEVAAAVEAQARARGIHLSAPRGLASVVARADADRVRQILLHLVDNGLKFTPRGGRVAVEYAYGGGGVVLRVRDTGHGIPRDRLESAFDPFVQLDRHRDETGRPGVGLGLAISRDLARGMGGDLVAGSGGETGSTFTLTLPAA